MEIITDIEQGSDAWFAHRLGSIGGSGIKKVIAKGTGKVRTKYLYQKVDEILTGRRTESYNNDDMQLGTDSEPLSRRNYEFIADVEIYQIAMVKNGNHKHSSPDGICKPDGIIEIKNTNGPNYVEIIYKDKIPPEHIPQIQWNMSISNRNWCDFVLACWMRQDDEIVPRYPDKPIWIKRVFRDEKKIAELNREADIFISEMLEIVEKLK